jgi:hypothetical protein
MRPASLNFSLIICTVSRRWLAQPARPNLRCVVLNWRCWAIWDTASIFCTARAAVTVEDTMTYRYREEKGFIASIVIDNSTFTGRQLRALYEREFPDLDTLRAAKRFTRIALKPYLGGKPLKSRELFRQFVPKR